jgi:5-carboxymethyl-2-hydroxymuconate isomerase
MPHCIIEYSKDLEKNITPQNMIDKTYQGALNTSLFISSDIKTRATAFDNYQTGNIRESFIHINVKILQGRTTEQRKFLSETILKEFQELTIQPLSITIEINELEKSSYSKLVK